MAQQVLVGSTGFVGGNLSAAHRFDLCLHSTNIEEGFAAPNGLVVYCGVPSAMFLANQSPEADLAIMRTARENLRRLRPEKTVLISTIAVYADSRGKTEADAPTPEGLKAYGANRLQLERWVREDYPDALIVRLPALYGRGLKKNFIFDFITVTPAMLRPDKYEALAAQSTAVQKGYTLADNGFYKLNGSVPAPELRAFFEANDFNALSFTDSRSVYQFYDLGRLWADIEKALAQGLTLLHLAPPPISAGEVYRQLAGREWQNHLAAEPYQYDLRTRYDALLGGSGGYLCTPEDEMSALKAFVTGCIRQGHT